MLSLADSFDVLTRSVGWCQVSNEVAIQMSGTDVEEWLQGQSSNDLRKLGDQRSLELCFCKPTGQVLAAACYGLLENTRVLILDRNAAESVLERCREMVIMEDVAAILDSRQVYTIQGLGSSAYAEGRIFHDRSGHGGFDGLGTPPAGLPELDPKVLEICSLESGMPIFGLDFDQSVLPPELGPVFESRHVSYSKGCYTGQEVLMRVHSRGHTNRSWTVLSCLSQLEVGAPVLAQDGHEVGKVGRVAWSPLSGWLASVMLRNEATTPMTQLRVGDEIVTVR